MTTISVVGLGKLGAPLLAVFANAGFDVIGVDHDETKVAALNRGEVPAGIVEPELADYLARGRAHYRVTIDTFDAALASDAVFVIVPTPSGDDGAFRLDDVLLACRDIGQAINRKDDYLLVVIVSTVMPGHMRVICDHLEAMSGKREGVGFGLCYNPEFIALGSVIHDIHSPDYVLIGAEHEDTGERLNQIYNQMFSYHHIPSYPRVVLMNWVNAEIAKIAQNAYITMKITFANELGRLCGAIPGANVDDVTAALGQDRRIGKHYLKAGTAYGGPCFPRDNRALRVAAKRYGQALALPKQVDSLNDGWVIGLWESINETLSGQRVSVLGLAYKPGTTVVEESAGVHLAQCLNSTGSPVVVYDPLAMDEARKVLGDKVTYADSAADCIRQSDVVVLMHPNIEVVIPATRRITLIDPWRTYANPEMATGKLCNYIPLGIGPEPGQVTA